MYEQRLSSFFNFTLEKMEIDLIYENEQLNKQNKGKKILKEPNYDHFINIPLPELYDYLLDVRNNLRDENEIKYIGRVMNNIPWAAIHQFFKLMKNEKIKSFETAWRMFIKKDGISKTLRTTQRLLATRRLIDSSFVNPIEKSQTKLIIDTLFGVNCIKDIHKAPWMANPSITNIVMRERNILNSQLTNRKWLGEHVGDNWYKVTQEWCNTVCRFGRPYAEDQIGYLLQDGRVIPEDYHSYAMSMKYFTVSQHGRILTAEEYQYAPWMSKTKYNETHYDLTHRMLGTINLGKENIDREVMRGWYQIKPEWFKKVVQHGRQYAPNTIGYQTIYQTVIPENRGEFDLMVKFISGRKYKTKYNCDSYLVPTWVDTAVTMVARKTPETKDWVLPMGEVWKKYLEDIYASSMDFQTLKNLVITQKKFNISDEKLSQWLYNRQNNHTANKWYYLKTSWYENICHNGRKWLPNTFGYVLRDGTIISETLEMFQAYLLTHEKQNKNLNYAADVILTEYFPRDHEEILSYLQDRHNLAHDVATLCIFSTKLISIPQIHLQRLEKDQYPIEILANLTKYEMLPEIYLNPYYNGSNSLTWSDYDKRFDAFIRLLEKRIIDGSNDDTILHRKRKVNQKLMKAVNVEVCSPNVIYYMENNVMYCFDCHNMKGITINPYTNNRFDSSFIRLVQSLKPPPERLVNLINNILKGIFNDSQLEDLVQYLIQQPMEEIANIVARLYVFSLKHIEGPQIHLEKIANGTYTLKSLIEADKFTMLPEIYKNQAYNPAYTAGVNWNDYDQKLEKLYNDTVAYFNSEVDASNLYTVEPTSQFFPDTTDTEDDMLVVEDSLTYPEGNPFTGGVPENVSTNPFMGAPENVSTNPFMDTGYETNPFRGGNSFYNFGNAPKLHGNKYNFGNKPLQCAYCLHKIKNTNYNSIYKQKPIHFCSSSCFSNFKFK